MNHKHRVALHALFTHPVSNNIDPRIIKSTLEEIGADISHGGHGQLIVKLSVRAARTDEKTGKSYEASNDVKAYKPAGGAPMAAPGAMPKPAAAAPAKSAPPWAKK